MSDIPTKEEVFEAFALWNEAIDPEDFRAEFDRFIAKIKADALEKVLELHRPVRGASRRSPDVCAECDALIGEPGYDCGGTVEYPCPTVQAVQSAIEGAIDD